MRMGRKKGTNKRGGGYVYVEGGGRHWRSGAIYVTCAVGNSDCRCWQLENQAKARHSTDTSTDTPIGDQPSRPSPSLVWLQDAPCSRCCCCTTVGGARELDASPVCHSSHYILTLNPRPCCRSSRYRTDHRGVLAGCWLHLWAMCVVVWSCVAAWWPGVAAWLRG
jgi:hypothetical protein